MQEFAAIYGYQWLENRLFSREVARADGRKWQKCKPRATSIRGSKGEV
jgi:hypothetical protein